MTNLWNNLCESSTLNERERAFTKLYQHYYYDMLGVLTQFDNCDKDQAQSIIQDVLTETYIGMDKLCERVKKDEQFNLKAYLKTIARNRFFKAYRKEKQEPEIKEFQSIDEKVDPFADDIKSLRDTHIELLDTVSRKCRKKVAPKDWHLLGQRYKHGKKIKDIAQKTGKTYAYLRTRIPELLRIVQNCGKLELSNA